MRKQNRLYYLVFILLLFSPLLKAWGPHLNTTYKKYIKQYYGIAIEQQKKYNIPASITLAQALLESGAGTSILSKRSNNHFGIKCHSTWKGKMTYANDDLPNECFRVYKNVQDSYVDHSLFLKRPRYASLFNLKKDDYRSWAKGLQRCGYATNRSYANRLIKIIEDYKLYQYDSKKYTKENPQNLIKSSYQIYKSYGLLYLYAKNADSYEQIAYNLGFKAKKLQKYNETPKGYPLQKGDIIYLVKKKKKADRPYYDHVVEAGESMHSISQHYGIQLKSLYKINKLKPDYVPEDGDVLKLR